MSWRQVFWAGDTVVFVVPLKVEKEKSYAHWLCGLEGGMVIFRGSFGGIPQTPPSCSSSCWEQCEGGIIFLLVTLPRMRGNPQSVGF
jgi:hypothetical protein